MAAEAVRPVAPGARLLQRSAHLRDVAGVPFRDRHLRAERHARVRGAPRRRASGGPPVAVRRRRRPPLRLLARDSGRRAPRACRAASAARARRGAVAPRPFRRAPRRAVPRPAAPGGARSLARRDSAAGDPDRAVAPGSRPPSRGGRRRRRRDRRGTPDAAAPRARALGRASRHAGTAPLARPARRPHRAAMAHADRPCRDASSPGCVPARLRAGHPSEPCGPAGLYRFFLARTWSTGLLADAGYVLEVEATSLNGRTGRRVLPFTIANDV